MVKQTDIEDSIQRIFYQYYSRDDEEKHGVVAFCMDCSEPVSEHFSSSPPSVVSTTLLSNDQGGQGPLSSDDSRKRKRSGRGRVKNRKKSGKKRQRKRPRASRGRGTKITINKRKSIIR